jgi:hypothetical protein
MGVLGCSSCRDRLNSVTVRAGILVSEVALGQVSLPVLGYSPANNLRHITIRKVCDKPEQPPYYPNLSSQCACHF